ncbi:MAG: hypothetical protein EXR36_01065 [Betaproteobacteria bacterium]|nr:hypothetical protein [Betaproteobacteria bacterium]
MEFARAILTASLGLVLFKAHAHPPAFEECLEASEFILHAAMSRDNGMTRQDFMGRVEADLRAIQGFPPEYRWFAQDEDDERFLVHHSANVFDDPRTPQIHQSDFLNACVGRMSSESTELVPVPAPAGPLTMERESRL